MVRVDPLLTEPVVQVIRTHQFPQARDGQAACARCGFVLAERTTADVRPCPKHRHAPGTVVSQRNQMGRIFVTYACECGHVLPERPA